MLYVVLQSAMKLAGLLTWLVVFAPLTDWKMNQLVRIIALSSASEPQVSSSFRGRFDNTKAGELTACPSARTELTASGTYSYSSCKWNSFDGKTKQGGVFHTIIAITIKITSCTATSCKSSAAGGFLYFTDATVTMTSCTFKTCSASGDYPGGVVYQGINSALTSVKCTFTSCWTKKGGGCFEIAYAPATLNVTGPSTFTTCYAKESSGGVIRDLAYDAGAKITASDLTVTGCDSRGGSSGGGFLWSYMGSSTISKCTFKNCWTSGGGGVVYQMTSTSSVSLSECTADNCSANTRNVADFGGGLLCAQGGTSSVKKCTMTKCYTINNGGALAFTQAKAAVIITVENCTIKECKSTTAYCGGIWVNGTSCKFTLKKLICIDCSAKNTDKGVAIYIQTELKTFSWSNLCIRGSQKNLITCAKSTPATHYWINWCTIAATSAYDVLPSKAFMKMNKLILDGLCYFVTV